MILFAMTTLMIVHFSGYLAWASRNFSWLDYDGIEVLLLWLIAASMFGLILLINIMLIVGSVRKIRNV